tara:strand:+ start:471 stop:944 length:474 start_codon:yes stop_codon:yes gene_type:complete
MSTPFKMKGFPQQAGVSPAKTSGHSMNEKNVVDKGDGTHYHWSESLEKKSDKRTKLKNKQKTRDGKKRKTKLGVFVDKVKTKINTKKSKRNQTKINKEIKETTSSNPRSLGVGTKIEFNKKAGKTKSEKKVGPSGKKTKTAEEILEKDLIRVTRKNN